MKVRPQTQISNYKFLRIARAILESGHKIRAKTFGASMYPVIRRNDIVVIKPYSFEDVKIGDIVARKTEEKDVIILHRVIYKKNNELIIKGDISTNKSPDLPVKKKHFLGILNGIERNGKAINMNSFLNKYYKSLAVFLSRHVYFILFIPAVFVRFITTPKLFLPKSVHWFRKIFLKKRIIENKRINCLS